MSSANISPQDGIDPNEWENYSLGDLTHINCYIRDRLLAGGYQVPFIALNMHWAEPLCPSIPDGRYILSYSVMKKVNFPF